MSVRPEASPLKTYHWTIALVTDDSFIIAPDTGLQKTWITIAGWIGGWASGTSGRFCTGVPPVIGRSTGVPPVIQFERTFNPNPEVPAYPAPRSRAAPRAAPPAGSSLGQAG